MLETLLNQRLANQQNNNLYRFRKIRTSSQNNKVICNSKSVISFCSNNYLGLANHPKIITALKQGTNKYGVGSGASQLISGYCKAHQQFEEAFADFVGRDHALLFSTGFMANMGVIDALMNAKSVIFQDKLNHASLLDAGKLSGAKQIRYAHLDFNQLVKKILQTSIGNKLIASESIFSMNGDLTPIPKLAKIAADHKIPLLIDDAHAIGTLGTKGSGSLEYFALKQHEVPILVSTLGKAFGCFGAVVSGSHALIESLLQFARSYIYTTAIPPALACAAYASLQIVQNETWRREKLNKLIDYFKKSAAKRDIKLLPSCSPIQSFVIGDPQKAVIISEQLFERGFWVMAIRPPSVPINTSRLRITLNCMHEEKELNDFLDNLAEIYATTRS